MSPQAATQVAPSASGTGRRGRVRNVVLWAVQVLTAAGFLLAAFAKITGAPPVVATFDAIGFGDWFRYLIAALEIAGAAALLIPLLSGLAGLAFVALLTGAVVVHLFVIGEGVASALPLLVLAAVVAWGRRRRTAQLVRLLTNREVHR